jgi:hypothetical protein
MRQINFLSHLKVEVKEKQINGSGAQSINQHSMQKFKSESKFLISQFNFLLYSD